MVARLPRRLDLPALPSQETPQGWTVPRPYAATSKRTVASRPTYTGLLGPFSPPRGCGLADLLLLQLLARRLANQNIRGSVRGKSGWKSRGIEAAELRL